MYLKYEHRKFWINCSYYGWWLHSRYSNWICCKVIKIVAVIVGLFLAGLAYLQYHQIANINWNEHQTVSEGALTTLSNAIIIQIPTFGNTSDQAAASLTMTSFDIPLTGICLQDLLLVL
jgi:uncharacterized membrane protein (Fun14 family)